MTRKFLFSELSPLLGKYYPDDVCPKYARNGQCNQGIKCSLLHLGESVHSGKFLHITFGAQVRLNRLLGNPLLHPKFGFEVSFFIYRRGLPQLFRIFLEQTAKAISSPIRALSYDNPVTHPGLQGFCFPDPPPPGVSP